LAAFAVGGARTAAAVETGGALAHADTVATGAGLDREAVALRGIDLRVGHAGVRASIRHARVLGAHARAGVARTCTGTAAAREAGLIVAAGAGVEPERQGTTARADGYEGNTREQKPASTHGDSHRPSRHPVIAATALKLELSRTSAPKQGEAWL